MALCTITGFVYMPNGQPAADRLFKFKTSRKGIAAGYFGAILPEVIEATTDELGFLTVQLLTGDYVAFSALYNGPVTVPDAEEASLYEVFGGTGSVTPPAIEPNFTVLPSLLGSTSLGGTITVNLGSATGSPEPVITGTLTRPGASPIVVTQGQLITVQAGDQGGSLSLTATATSTAGVDTETVSRAIPAAIPAPVFNTSLPDIIMAVGDADVVVNLDDYADNATSYSVSPSGGSVTISGSIMTTSAGAAVDQLYVVTATGPGGVATDEFGVLVEAVPGELVGGAAIGAAGPTGSIYEGFRLADGDDFNAAPTRWTGRNLTGRYGHSAMHIGFRRTSGSDSAMYIDPAFRGARSQSPVDLGYDGASINDSVLSLTASTPPAELVPLLPTVFTGGSGDELNRPKLITGGLKTGPSFMFSAQGGFVIEGKVRLQAGIIHGYWPSFWTSTFFWPDQGEIDIVEVSKNPTTGVNSSQMNLHRSAAGGGTIRVATPTYPSDRWVTTAVRRMQGSTLIEFFDDADTEGVMVLRDTMETPLGSIDGAHDIRLDMAVSNSWDTTTFNPEHWPAKVDFDWWRAWVPTTAAYANEPTLILPAVRTTPGGSWAATFPAASELYSPGAGQEQVTAAFDNHDAPGMPTRSGTTKLPTSMSVNMTARTVSGAVPTTEGGCTGVFLTRSYDDGSPVQRVLLPFHVAPAIQSLASGWSFDQGAAVDITIPYTAFHSGNLGPHTYQVTAPGLTVTGNGTTEVRITGTASATTSITVEATNIEGQTTSATRSMTVVAAGAAWVTVVPQDSGPVEARGVVTANGDGSYRVTTQGTSAGRAHFTQPAAGSVVELEVSMQFNDATRLILRQVGLFSSNTGITVLDVARTSVGQVLTQTITYTVDASRPLMHLIGVTNQGQYFTVNAAMRYRVIS